MRELRVAERNRKSRKRETKQRVGKRSGNKRGIDRGDVREQEATDMIQCTSNGDRAKRRQPEV